jgi:hypothetical protein
MTRRSFAGLALSGTLALAGSGAAGLGTFNASHIENTAASIAERTPTPPESPVVTTAASVRVAAAGKLDPPESVAASAGSSAATVLAVEPVSTAPRPEAPPETGMQLASAPTSDLVDDGPKPSPETGMQLASAPTSDLVDDGPKPSVRSIEPPRQCATDVCIDEYLWSLYERTPKIDTVKVPNQTKVTVKKNGKTRTVTKTAMTYVTDDFTWKDPAAAQRSGISPMDYVIGGMDRGFKLKLYRALCAMDEAGLMPGITSGFRDDYRQSIAAGLKAAADSSYHGGSRRGGYRHGLAADLVSVKGDTRSERSASSDDLWRWIDAHEKEFGIGRPYRDRDPPHVGPIDGMEYVAKRGAANAQRRALQTKKAEKPRAETTRPLAARTDSGATKPATSSKLSSLQKRPILPR